MHDFILIVVILSSTLILLMGRILRFFFFLAGICLLTSCKKEEEHAVPVVNFIEPVENQIYNVFDTLHVRAEVLSDDPLTGLQVTLVNQQLTPVLPMYPISLNTPHSGQWDIDQSIPIDAISLESGKYYVCISAFTSYTSKNKYQPISLVAVKRVLEKILVLSQTGVNTLTLYDIDTALQVHAIHTFGTDYGHVCMDALSRQLYVAGKNTSKLWAYHVDRDSVCWTLQGAGTPGRPFYQGLKLDHSMLYVSTSNGKCTGYTVSGSVDFYVDLGFSLYPVQSCLQGGRLVLPVVKVTGGQNYINQYYYPSGAYQAGLQTLFRSVALEPVGQYQVLVAGNLGSQGTLQYYDVLQQQIHPALSASVDSITGLVAADEENYLVAGLQRIWWFHAPAETIIEFLDNLDIKYIDYDVTGDRLLVAEPGSVNIYQFPSSQLQFSVNIPGTVQACLPLYNR